MIYIYIHTNIVTNSSFSISFMNEMFKLAKLYNKFQ